VRFGVNVLNFGPHATPEVLARWAERAESLGYHLAMISDHVAITADVQAQYPAPFYDPFLTLAWLAGQTRRIELGTTVTILPYRHPLQTARLAANLDQLSGGRFILGVGVGWARQEFAALGVPFEKRGAITNEYLEVITACFRDEVVQGVHTAPRPVRERLPIWVGGNSDAAIRRTVKYGDAWHPINKTAAWLRDHGLLRLKQIAAEQGRPVPDLCPRITVSHEGSLDDLRREIDAIAALGAKYVLLDTYAGKPETMPPPEADWALLERIAPVVL
jgi:probable F420-dependent oxidoreductase